MGRVAGILIPLLSVVTLIGAGQWLMAGGEQGIDRSAGPSATAGTSAGAAAYQRGVSSGSPGPRRRGPAVTGSAGEANGLNPVRTKSPSAPPSSQSGLPVLADSAAGDHLRALIRDSGLSYRQAMSLARQLDSAEILAFLDRDTRMDEAWRQRNGITSDGAVRIFARWLADRANGTGGTGERVGTSAYAGRNDSIYRIQRRFDDDVRSIHVHYSIPDDYVPQSVVIKWFDTSARSMAHMDRHKVSNNPQLMQHAWIRRQAGWEPGTYHVEVYASDDSLELLGATEYVVGD